VSEEPLFSDTNLSKGQLLSLIMAFFLRHNLTKSSLSDLLQLLSLLVPSVLSKSRYLFEKIFDIKSSAATLHYYCEHCSSYLGESEGTLTCKTCNLSMSTKELAKKNCYFLVGSLEEQFRKIFDSHDVGDKISARKLDGLFSDGKMLGEIYTGDLYREEKLKQFLLEDGNFSVTVNTDGVKIFHSSKFSVWPLLLSINELNYNEKAKHIVICCLWFGNEKPNVDTFLEPFIIQARRLSKKGFQWKDSSGRNHISKVAFPLLVADAPARAMLTNFMQYNGSYGCGFCEHEGKRVAKGDGTVQVYPLVHPLPPNRSHEKSYEQAQTATLSLTQHVGGVKGMSLLYLLPFFDVIKGVVPDYMHCILLGIVKQFLNLWLTSTNEPFHIKNGKLIDEIILTACPPDEIRRVLRSLDHRLIWKASEFRVWLLFYSPVVLRHLLPHKYYKHWLILVKGMHMLLKKNISREDVEVVRKLFFKFVSQVELLYGEEQVSYNVHLLQHVVDSVTYWGCPWAYSAFMYEDIGGTLKYACHGTTQIGKQIFSSVLKKANARDYAKLHIPFAEDLVKEMYHRLDAPLSGNRTVRGLGKSLQNFLQPEDVNSIQNRLGKQMICTACLSYERLAANGEIFSCMSYSSRFKRNNSVINCLDGKTYNILKIFKICLDCTCATDERTCWVSNRSNSLESFYVFIGENIPFKRHFPILDEHTLNDLGSVVSKINRNGSRSLTNAIIPQDVISKSCLLLCENEMYCMKNDIRFEKD
jgi:hypothetical protein